MSGGTLPGRPLKPNEVAVRLDEPRDLDLFARTALRFASDEAVARPLWEWRPRAVKAVLSERRRRGILQDPDEQAVDPLYH